MSYDSKRLGPYESLKKTQGAKLDIRVISQGYLCTLSPLNPIQQFKSFKVTQLLIEATNLLGYELGRPWGLTRLIICNLRDTSLGRDMSFR